MHREEAERVVGIAKGVVELGVSLALLPVKLALRAVRPAPADDRWAPAPVRPATSPAGTPAKGYAEGGAAAAQPAAAAEPAAPAPAPAPTPTPAPRRRATPKPRATTPEPPRAPDLTAADAGRVRETRRAAEGGTLGAKLRVDAPWEGYDAQNVATIVAALRGADPAQRAIVRLYEETHKNRAGVLRATE